MTSFTFLLFFVPILSLILIGLNLLLATHKPYKEKDSSFECGFHSFLGQNRSEFSISFFLFGLLFLIFDLEIVLSFPYVVSGYHNTSYGLTIIFFFFIFLTVGFCFEIGKKALTINSRQINAVNIPAKFIPQDIDIVKSYNPKKKNYNYIKRNLNTFSPDNRNNPKHTKKNKIKRLFNKFTDFIEKNYGYCIILVIYIIFFKLDIRDIFWVKSEPSIRNYIQFLIVCFILNTITKLLYKNKDELNYIVVLFPSSIILYLIIYCVLDLITIIIPYLILFLCLYLLFRYFNHYKK